ncbi:MAG: sulfatase [Kiritimatiellaeota bacterium]|nr:sulfatase [Kiritimatiellota bacterium]
MRTDRRPNVLVFIPHDLGDYLHCYGHPTVRSPHLDELASEGVRFTSYFTSAPECTSSRGCMMTGRHSHQHGLMGLCWFGWDIFPRVPHLAARLRDAGYQTHLFGMQHETDGPPDRLGYLHNHPSPGCHAANVCRDLVEFLRSTDARSGSPWFACAGFKQVHRPWDNTSAFAPDAVNVPPYLPDNPTIRDDLTHFHQDILEMDTAIGEVLSELRRSDVGERTMVVFTTDHGAAFPHAKATFYDPGIHIPLIVHWPGHMEGGREFNELLSNVDFTPTILDCCGLDVPGDIPGRSFLPLIRGEPYHDREAVYGALFYDVSYDPMHYVRTGTHKYIRSFAVTPEDAEGADERVLATFVAGRWIRVDDADVMSSPAWQSMDVDCSRPLREELYDLARDPWEQRNLVESPEAQSVLHGLRYRLRRMMEDTQSPLLDGHVAPPRKQVEQGRHCRERLGIG